jgi:hypothetical protein
MKCFCIAYRSEEAKCCTQGESESIPRRFSTKPGGWMVLLRISVKLPFTSYYLPSVGAKPGILYIIANRCAAARGDAWHAAMDPPTPPHDLFAPIRLLAGHVRNKKEARVLVNCVDCQAQHAAVLDHLLACSSYELELSRALSGIEMLSGSDARLHAARALIASALDGVRRDIDALVAQAAEHLNQLDEACRSLRTYAENNEATYLELSEEGSAQNIASSRQRLWLVEESLAARIELALAGHAAAQLEAAGGRG